MNFGLKRQQSELENYVRQSMLASTWDKTKGTWAWRHVEIHVQIILNSYLAKFS